MNYKNVLVGIFAILASALILNLPLVGAVQINIMRPSGSNWVKHDEVTINPENLISRSVSIENIGGVFWTNAKIIIDISNSTTSADIEMAYVYACKGSDPSSCMDTESPDKYDIMDNELSVELLWNDIRDVTTSCSSSPSSCMETSNLFLLFKVNDNGKTVWVGIWNKMERRTYDFAEPYLYEYGLDEMDLRTETSFLNLVGDFIGNYLKIPFNPVWVSGAVFSGASSLFELSVSSSELGQSSPNFQVANYMGNEIESISDDYSFIFTETSYGITNPVTLNLNPSFTCGSYGCESEKGESTTTCCYDCGCAEDYYCDGGIEGTCKRDDLISIVIYGTPDTSIENCNEQHTVNITVEIDRAPSDASITASSYILEGDSSSVSCQEIYSNVYLCPVIVPPMSDCESGEYIIGPNYIEFTISYSDGPGSKTKELSVQFPDIAVGSFTCGENGCETSLGENQQNCCYDCGCSSGYCDIEDGAAPTTSQCKEHPGESTIQVKADPTHIYNHVSGDRIELNVKIEDAPRSLTITSDSCEMDCYYNCTASCDVSCSEIASSDPDAFNASCMLTFTIANYDSLTDYTIYPTLNLSVTYNDGPSETVSKTLSKTFSTISVGASWCGDGICTPGENSNNCCYDCACPEGYYCDTADIGAPTQGDKCEEEVNMKLVASFETFEVDYPYESHDIRVIVQVNNAPSSMTGEMYCGFGNTDDYCAMSCEKVGSDDSHVLDCNLTTPIIDYKTSELYDPIARRIVLGPGAMTYSATYNDGSGWATMDLNTTFDNITINVKAKCGAGPGYFGMEGEHCLPYDTTLACETDLDESYSTCCCDCPCPESKFCYISSDTDDGTCRSVNSVNILINKFEPDPKKCRIQPPDKKGCVFYDSLSATITITPTADYILTTASFKMGAETSDAICILISETSPFNVYSCSAVLPNIKSKTIIQDSMVKKKIEISASVQSLGLLDATISGSKTLQIKKEKSKELKTIEEQIQDIEDIEDSIKSLRTWLYGIGIVLVLTCIAIAIWVQNLLGKCIAFDICIFIDFIGMLTKIDKALDLIKGYKKTLSTASLPIEINKELIDIKYTFLEIMGTIGKGAVCAFMFGKSIDSALGTSASKGITVTDKKAYTDHFFSWFIIDW